MLVCVDTMVLIWAVRGIATEGQDHVIGRTRAYLSSLDQANHRIMVPTPAICEFLAPLSTEDRSHQLTALEKQFVVAPFDLRAAVFAAEIFASHRQITQRESANEESLGKPMIKLDCQIVAIAKAHGAQLIVSHDKWLRRIADGHVKAIDIPEREEQIPLPFPPSE